MWTFLATLAGGLIALLASVSTTYYVQQQAVKAERRTRATRAADDILAAVTELRGLSGEPDSSEAGRWIEWHDQKRSLAYRIQTQTLLIPVPELRERLSFVVQAILRDDDLLRFESLNERSSRFALCAEALSCLGAYYRGEPMPPENPVIPQARAAIETANDLRNER